MPKLISSNHRTGKSNTYETMVPCKSCGNTYSSLETHCTHCGVPNPANHKGSTYQRTGKVLQGEDLARVKAGGGNCMYCGTLTWTYDEKKNGFVCPECGAGTGIKSDFELGGGTEESSATSRPEPRIHASLPKLASVMPTWQKVGIAIASFLAVWFIISLFNTHEVRGHVIQVYWERQAHQTEKQLLQGEGFGLPMNATPIGSPISKIYDYQENIVGYTHGTYTEMSTPEVIDHTHSIILVETPGAYFTAGPYHDCGEATQEVGGSVSYDECGSLYQEDSTWGEAESEETPVYAPQVPVEMTTGPTPIYGTPTPIYKDWYVYTYWEWVTTLTLPMTSGNDNVAYWPAGLNDEYHQVVNDNEYYKVVIQFDNGYEATYDGSDPNLLKEYLLGNIIVGKFNIFGIFMGEVNQPEVLP